MMSGLQNGADDGIRTRDLFITNEVLYQLSYVGLLAAPANLCDRLLVRYILRVRDSVKQCPATFVFRHVEPQVLQHLLSDCVCGLVKVFHSFL
jgi:hypothetical protein